MLTHETHERRSPTGRPGRHRLLPIAGGGVAVAAALAHLGGGALVIGIVAVVAIKLLVVFGVFKGAVGARRGLRRQ